MSEEISEYRIGSLVAEAFDDWSYFSVDFKRHLRPEFALTKEVDFDLATFRPQIASYYHNGVLMAQLRWVFKTDANNLVTLRREEISYTLLDGSQGPWFTIKNQIYNIARSDHRSQMVQERERTRRDLINDISIIVFGVLPVIRPGQDPNQLGGELFDRYSSQLNAFYKTGGDFFKAAIQNDTLSDWLDEPFPQEPSIDVRTYVISRLPA